MKIAITITKIEHDYECRTTSISFQIRVVKETFTLIESVEDTSRNLTMNAVIGKSYEQLRKKIDAMLKETDRQISAKDWTFPKGIS